MQKNQQEAGQGTQLGVDGRCELLRPLAAGSFAHSGPAGGAWG